MAATTQRSHQMLQHETEGHHRSHRHHHHKPQAIVWEEPVTDEANEPTEDHEESASRFHENEVELDQTVSSSSTAGTQGGGGAAPANTAGGGGGGGGVSTGGAGGGGATGTAPAGGGGGNATAPPHSAGNNSTNSTAGGDMFIPEPEPEYADDNATFTDDDAEPTTVDPTSQSFLDGLFAQFPLTNDWLKTFFDSSRLPQLMDGSLDQPPVSEDYLTKMLSNPNTSSDLQTFDDTVTTLQSNFVEPTMTTGGSAASTGGATGGGGGGGGTTATASPSPAPQQLMEENESESEIESESESESEDEQDTDDSGDDSENNMGVDRNHHHHKRHKGPHWFKHHRFSRQKTIKGRFGLQLPVDPNLLAQTVAMDPTKPLPFDPSSWGSDPCKMKPLHTALTTYRDPAQTNTQTLLAAIIDAVNGWYANIKNVNWNKCPNFKSTALAPIKAAAASDYRSVNGGQNYANQNFASTFGLTTDFEEAIASKSYGDLLSYLQPLWSTPDQQEKLARLRYSADYKGPGQHSLMWLALVNLGQDFRGNLVLALSTDGNLFTDAFQKEDAAAQFPSKDITKAELFRILSPVFADAPHAYSFLTLPIKQYYFLVMGPNDDLESIFINLAGAQCGNDWSRRWKDTRGAGGIEAYVDPTTRKFVTPPMRSGCSLTATTTAVAPTPIAAGTSPPAPPFPVGIVYSQIAGVWNVETRAGFNTWTCGSTTTHSYPGDTTGLIIRSIGAFSRNNLLEFPGHEGYDPGYSVATHETVHMLENGLTEQEKKDLLAAFTKKNANNLEFVDGMPNQQPSQQCYASATVAEYLAQTSNAALNTNWYHEPHNPKDCAKQYEKIIWDTAKWTSVTNLITDAGVKANVLTKYPPASPSVTGFWFKGLGTFKADLAPLGVTDDQATTAFKQIHPDDQFCLSQPAASCPDPVCTLKYHVGKNTLGWIKANEEATTVALMQTLFKGKRLVSYPTVWPSPFVFPFHVYVNFPTDAAITTTSLTNVPGTSGNPTTATCVTSSPHGYTVGDFFQINNGGSYNGEYNVAAVTDPSTFTFTMTFVPTAGGPGATVTRLYQYWDAGVGINKTNGLITLTDMGASKTFQLQQNSYCEASVYAPLRPSDLKGVRYPDCVEVSITAPPTGPTYIFCFPETTSYSAFADNVQNAIGVLQP